MRSFRSAGWCLAVILVTVGLMGCSENQNKKPTNHRVEGVAKMIDLENNYVSMMVKDEKGKERELQGTIRADTEVFINGRSQALKDVRVGDQVVVDGFREGQGDNQKLVATRVEVKRPLEADWKTTGTNPPRTPESAKLTSDKPATPAQPTPPTAAPHTPAGQPPATPPKAPADEAKQREQLTDLIYARVRVEMETKIAKRAEMLKAGRDPADPEIRALEGSIMQARNLLVEAGEVAPDIQPPITQPPAPKPGETKPGEAKPATPKG